MKLISSLRCLVCACLLVPMSAMACSQSEAEAFVRQFYKPDGHPGSVPELSQLNAPGHPYGERLHGLLASAARYRAEFIESHPPEPSGDNGPPVIYKPPFVDGDIFTGSPDGSRFFEIVWTRSRADGSRLVYVRSLPDPGLSPWQVYVTVVPVQQKCAIDEVHYDRYPEGATLSSHLEWRPPSDPQAPIAIRDVTLVDVASGELRPHTTVLVLGSRITEVGPVADTAVPRGARVIEGQGRFLIPGLWDMHSHSLWSPEAMAGFLPLYVAQGVTGIRDMGGSLEVLADYRAAMRQGDVPWPRVVAAGQVLDGPEPVQAEISMAVADAAGAVAAVDTLKRADADFIKVYTMLGREAYFAALAQAKRLGLPVAGHLPAAITPEEAALAGQASIEHLRDELEPLLCSPSKPDDCARLAALFREHRTWQVPTLMVLRNKAHFDDPGLAADPRLRYLPASLRAEWLAERTGKLGRGSDYLARKRAWNADEAWVARTLIREGVPMLAGSDAGVAFSYPGFSLHDELALLVEMGMTPLQALRAATLSPADYLDERASMGTIEAGKVADMVLLRENPLADIGATRGIEAVVLRGRVLDRKDLDSLLEAVAAGAQ